MKLEVTELSYLFVVIDREISKSKLDKRKLNAISKMMKYFAREGFMLGCNGKIMMEVGDDNS